MLLRKYIGICSMALCLFFSSQAQEVSETESKIRHIKKLIAKEQANPDSISFHTDDLERLSQAESDERGMLYVSYFRGVVLGQRELADSSINVLKGTLARISQAERDSSLLYSSVMLILGNSYYIKGDYKNALDSYLAVKSETERIRKEETAYNVEYNVGLLYMLMGDMDLAYKYFSIARNHFDQLSPPSQVKLYGSFGTYYSKLKQLDSAAYYYQKALDGHKANGDLRGVAHGFNNLAIVAYLQGKTEEAIVGFEAALDVRLQLSNKKNISDSYYNIGLLYAGVGKYDEAIRNYREGLKFASRLESLVGQRDISLELADSFRQLDQFDSAYIYLSNWRILNDSFLVKNKQNEILALEKRFETDRIKKDQELAEKETELRTFQRNVLLIGIVAVIIISVIAFYISRLRYQRNMALSEKDKLQAQSESELTMRELELKKEEIANYTNQLIHKNQILEELKARLEEHQSIEDKISTLDYGQITDSIAPHLHDEKDWLHFKLQFEKAYPEFFNKLLAHSSELSSYDQRLASLIKVNLSNKEISQVLNISADSVAKAKYRLRQKLAFTTYPQLESFIQKA